MKAFRFYSGELIYGFSGKDENEAKEALFEFFGKMEIDKVEEIPESEWDKKFIAIYFDNDRSLKPDMASIRDEMWGEEPCFLFSNDKDF